MTSAAGLYNDAARWDAAWISPTDEQTENRLNSWYCFRTSLVVDEVVSAFPVKIACDSKYWLWVDGQLVVLEGGLKRGPSPTGTYYDVVDLAPHLRIGENEIAILVWHFGKHGFSHNDSGEVGLIVDGQTNGLVLRSSGDWSVLRHPAFEDAGAPRPNFRLPEGNIRFDARIDIPGWQTDGQSEGWPFAQEKGEAGTAPWGELVRRPIKQWKDYGLLDYAGLIETTANKLSERDRLVNSERIEKGVGKSVARSEGDTRRVLIGELPYNCHVHPYLAVTAPEGMKIDIQTDLLSNGRDNFIRAEYVTKEGYQEFELPGWMNGHEVRYFLPEGVAVHSVKYRETGYNADFVGEFRSNDELINSLWRKAARTLYVTMRDTYMDCPDRERAQWWGDAVNQIGEAFYVFDADKGPLLARKAMYELAAYQRSDDTLYSPVPAGGREEGAPHARDGAWSRELPCQMLASVGYYGFWNYYRYSGDAKAIRDLYPAVKRYLDVWEQGEDGLAIHRAGEWDWTDWGKNQDIAVLENAWLHLALRGAREMALLLDKSEDAAIYAERMAEIEGAFNRSFWQGAYYRSAGHEGEIDDRGNALAVVAGLARPEFYPAIGRVLQSEMHASPYMEKYVLEALYIMEMPDLAYERMLARYTPMIKSDETTLWENFPRPGSSEPGSGTYNHAWSGGPLTLMHQYIAGIEPIEPAFERFSVKPQLGPLQSIETVVPSQFGDIRFSADRDRDGTVSFRLVVPKGATAEFFYEGRSATFPEGSHVWSTKSRNLHLRRYK